MAQNFVLAIDQGTTATTAIILDVSGTSRNTVIARASVSFKQYYPRPGWVEHDLDDIWASVQKATLRAISECKHEYPHFDQNKIIAIGITNQRETLCIFERTTGAALSKAIVWQCRRSTEICRIIGESESSSLFYRKTGLVIDPYFTGSKIRWIFEEAPEIGKLIRNGRALIGTVDTFLIHRLTRGEFVTEPSNASRTLLFDIHTGQWDKDLLEIFKVPSLECLAQVKDSASLLGKTMGNGFLPDQIPITCALGDQQAALAGQLCFDPGDAKCTYGTGAFLLLQLGKTATRSKNKLLTTVSWSLNGQRYYALEGSSFVAGAAVQFLRDNLNLVENATDTEYLASDVRGAPEIYFVPALAGLGAPWWNPKARGAFFGLTRGTKKNQLVRAALEGMAFQVCDLIEAMSSDCGHALKFLRVDGGASANNLLMQVQANLAGISVERPHHLETTAMGAGFFAALGLGIYTNPDELKKLHSIESTFHPVTLGKESRLRDEKIKGWKRAVKAAELFSQD